jgi:hypothetical protein
MFVYGATIYVNEVIGQQIQVVMIALFKVEEPGSSAQIVLRDMPRNVEQVCQLVGTDALLNIPEEAVVCSTTTIIAGSDN